MVAPPLLRQFLGVVNKVGGYETHTYSAPSRPSLVVSGRPLGQPAPQRSPDPPTPAHLRNRRGVRTRTTPLPRMRSAFGPTPMDAVSNPLAAELPPNHRTPPGARLLGAVCSSRRLCWLRRSAAGGKGGSRYPRCPSCWSWTH